MQLNVPLIRQEKDSIDCGLAGLCMLLKYYSIDKSVSELKKELKVYEGVGTYVPQLGKYLIDNGFNVEIVFLNPHLFTKKFENKTQKDLLNHIEQVLKETTKERWKPPLTFFIEFMKAGGKVTVRIPTSQDIKEEIARKRPVCALITSNFLSKEKPSFNFHFNLITGIDEKYVYVNDPMWDERGGHHKHELNDFIYALYASAHGDVDNASIMKVKKK